MSKGGAPSETTSNVRQTTSTLPEYAQPYYEDLLARTGYETSLPYETYDGQRLAYFSPMEQAGLQQYGLLGMSGTPEELNQAGRMALEAGTNLGGINASSDYRAGSPVGAGYNATSRNSGYTAGELGDDAYYQAGQREVGFDPGSLADSEAIEAYMNPYYQNVVDIDLREATRQADIIRRNTGLSAAGQGSLGGYREALEQAENSRNLMQNRSDIQHRGSSDAFTNAQQAFEADRQANAMLEQFGQSQFGMNEQARQRAAELVQQGFSLEEAARQAQEQFGQSQFGLNSANSQFQAQQALNTYTAQEQARQQQAALQLEAAGLNVQGLMSQVQAAGLLGDFANQRQGMELERLAAMMQAGGMERGMAQRSLDMGYQDFLRQQAYGRENLGLYNNVLQGLPITPGSTVSTYGPQPSTTQQLLGAGIGGLGLYNAFGGGNSP